MLLSRRFICRSTSQEFDAWVRANPFPGRPGGSLRKITEVNAGDTPDAPARSVRNFNWSDTPSVLRQCMLQAPEGIWSHHSEGFTCLHSATGAKLTEVVLPAVLQPLQYPEGLLIRAQDLSVDLADLQACGTHIAVLLSADSAALGVWRDGKLSRHKCYTGYTVRRKAGKAQMTYLRRGGSGSTVGGGIRRRETERLFSSAASRLVEWEQDVCLCDKAFFSGTVRVWNELYSADANLEKVIARRDNRWQHVGISVRRPRLADLRRAFWHASHGTVLDYN